MRGSVGFAFVSVLAVLGAAGCGSPSVPAMPAYDADVLPILMARCVRCHGAGGMLNLPTEPTGPNAPPLPSVSDPIVRMAFAGFNLYLNQYDSTGDCTANPPLNCKQGARADAKLIANSVQPATQPPLAMPPAPSPPLADWAVEILDNWAAEAPPVCSNSPTPDRTICPNGP